MKEKITDSELSPVNLWKLLNNSRFAIVRLHRMELKQFGITIEQSSILQTISEKNGLLTIKELEEETMRLPNWILVLVNHMVKIGLLRIEKTKPQKRHRIYLTQEGKNLIENVTSVSIDMPFKSLTTKEKNKC